MQKRITLHRVGILCAIAALLLCCGILLAGCQQEEKTIEVNKPYISYLYTNDLKLDKALSQEGIDQAKENLKNIGATDIEIDEDQYMSAIVPEQAWKDFVESRRADTTEFLEQGVSVALPGNKGDHKTKPTSVEINDQLNDVVITVDDEVFSSSDKGYLYSSYAGLRQIRLNPLYWLANETPDDEEEWFWAFCPEFNVTIQDTDGKALMNNEIAQKTELPDESK